MNVVISCNVKRTSIRYSSSGMVTRPITLQLHLSRKGRFFHLYPVHPVAPCRCVSMTTQKKNTFAMLVPYRHTLNGIMPIIIYLYRWLWEIRKAQRACNSVCNNGVTTCRKHRVVKIRIKIGISIKRILLKKKERQSEAQVDISSIARRRARMAKCTCA